MPRIGWMAVGVWTVAATAHCASEVHPKPVEPYAAPVASPAIVTSAATGIPSSTPSETGTFAVEEHFVVAVGTDEPKRSEYLRRIDPGVLKKRERWRERRADPTPLEDQHRDLLARYDYELLGPHRTPPVHISVAGYDLKRGS